MEDQDEFLPQDAQAIRDQVDDEIVNGDLMERLASRPLLPTPARVHL
jgi:hypothetical protein